MQTTSPVTEHKSADFATSKSQPSAGAKVPLNKEDFARHWGFASFLELFEASQPVGNAGGKKKWLVTSIRGGKWLLWNEAETGSAWLSDSRDEALPNVSRQSNKENSEAAKMQG